MAKTKIEISSLASTEKLVGDLTLNQMRSLIDCLYVMKRTPNEKNIAEWRANFLDESDSVN